MYASARRAASATRRFLLWQAPRTCSTAFDWPDEVPDILDTDMEGGRGLFLIESVMSEVKQERKGEKNVLTLRREVEPPNPVAWRAESDTRNVLVADDDPAIRVMITKVVESTGARVRAVSDGAQALQALESDDFDAALRDIMMPRLTGLDVVSKYRGRHDCRLPFA